MPEFKLVEYRLASVGYTYWVDAPSAEAAIAKVTAEGHIAHLDYDEWEVVHEESRPSEVRVLWEPDDEEHIQVPIGSEHHYENAMTRSGYVGYRRKG